MPVGKWAVAITRSLGAMLTVAAYVLVLGLVAFLAACLTMVLR